MHLLFFDRDLTARFRNAEDTSRKFKLIAMTDEAHRLAISQGYSATSFLEYLTKDDWHAIDEKVIDWFTRLSTEPVSDGVNLIEFFFYRGDSYWWFMEQFIDFPGGLFDIVKYVHAIKAIIKRENPIAITVALHDPVILRIVEQTAVDKEITLVNIFRPASTLRPKLKVKSAVVRWLRSVYYQFSFFHPVRRVLTGWTWLRRNAADDGVKGRPFLIMSFVPYALREVYDPLTGTTRVTDSYWYSVERQIKIHQPEVPILHVALRIDRSQDKSIRGRITTYRQLFRLAPKFVQLDYYMTLADSLRIGRESRMLTKRWESLVESGSLHELLRHEEIDFSDSILSHLTALMPSITGLAVRYVRLMERVIEKERPSVVAMHGESQCVGRSIIAACQRHNVPTLGLQHGCISTVFRSHYLTYFHASENYVRHESAPNPTGCPIPTKTMVWGEYWRDGLVNRMGFPPESIAITGNPRYDALLDHASYDRSSIREQLGLNASKFTILYPTASATYRSDFQPTENNAIHMKAVLDMFETLENAQLLIKIHPVDDPDLYDEELRRRWKHPDIRVLMEDDVLKLISVSDLLVTRYSGTILEAAAFGVPSINLDVINVPAYIDFVGQGGALGVSREEDLRPAVCEFINGGEVVTRLEAQRATFLFKWIRGVDGMSSVRAMQLALTIATRG